jgi:hypothetical protein
MRRFVASLEHGGSRVPHPPCRAPSPAGGRRDTATKEGLSLSLLADDDGGSF